MEQLQAARTSPKANPQAVTRKHKSDCHVNPGERTKACRSKSPTGQRRSAERTPHPPQHRSSVAGSEQSTKCGSPVLPQQRVQQQLSMNPDHLKQQTHDQFTADESVSAEKILHVEEKFCKLVRTLQIMKSARDLNWPRRREHVSDNSRIQHNHPSKGEAPTSADSSSVLQQRGSQHSVKLPQTCDIRDFCQASSNVCCATHRHLPTDVSRHTESSQTSCPGEGKRESKGASPRRHSVCSETLSSSKTRPVQHKESARRHSPVRGQSVNHEGNKSTSVLNSRHQTRPSGEQTITLNSRKSAAELSASFQCPKSHEITSAEETHTLTGCDTLATEELKLHEPKGDNEITNTEETHMLTGCDTHVTGEPGLHEPKGDNEITNSDETGGPRHHEPKGDNEITSAEETPMPKLCDTHVPGEPKPRKTRGDKTRAQTALTSRPEPPMLAAESGGQEAHKCSKRACSVCDRNPQPSHGRRSSPPRPKESQPFHTKGSSPPSDSPQPCATPQRYPNYLKPKTGITTHKCQLNPHITSTDYQKHAMNPDQSQSPEHRPGHNSKSEGIQEKGMAESQVSDINTQEDDSQTPTASKGMSRDPSVTETYQDMNQVENQQTIQVEVSLSEGPPPSSERPIVSPLSGEETGKPELPATDMGLDSESPPADSSLPVEAANEEHEEVGSARTSSTANISPLAYPLHTDDTWQSTERENAPQEEAKHVQELCTEYMRQASDNSEWTNPMSSAEVTTRVLQSASVPIGNFHDMLQTWKKELLEMLTALESSDTDVVNPSCPMCLKENVIMAQEDNQTTTVLQELHHMIAKLRQSPMKLSDNYQASMLDAIKECACTGVKEVSCDEPRTFQACHTTGCSKAMTAAVQQSIHILVDYVDLLLDTLDLFRYASSEKMSRSPLTDEVNEEMDKEHDEEPTARGQDVSRLDHLEHHTRDCPLSYSRCRSAVLKRLSESRISHHEGKSPTPVPHRESTGSLAHLFANVEHWNRKACSETVSILKSKQILEQPRQGQFRDYCAPFSDSCLRSCYTDHNTACGKLHIKHSPAKYRTSEHDQKNEEYVGKNREQFLRNLLVPLPPSKRMKDLEESTEHDTEDDHVCLKGNEALLKTQRHGMNTSRSPSAVQEPESVCPALVPSTRQLEQGSGQNRALGKFLLRYLQHIESRLAMVQNQHGHGGKPPLYEGTPRVLPKATITGSPCQPQQANYHQMNPRRSALDLALLALSKSLERLIAAEHESGIPTSPNSPYLPLIQSCKNIINNLSQLQHKDMKSKAPEHRYVVLGDAIDLERPDSSHHVQRSFQIPADNDQFVRLHRKGYTGNYPFLGIRDASSSSNTIRDGSVTALSERKDPRTGHQQNHTTQRLTMAESGAPPGFHNSFFQQPHESELCNMDPCPTILDGSPRVVARDLLARRKPEEPELQSPRRTQSGSWMPSCGSTSPLPVSAVQCTSSCVSVTGSEGGEGGVSAVDSGVQQAFDTIDQTLRHLATLMGKSPHGQHLLPPNFS